MEDRAKKAKEFFANGYNCAQSVFGAFSEEEGLELNTAFRLANGFGGGVRCGEVCGAVSGALMVIGLKCGFYVEKDLLQKEYCNQKSFEFIEAFRLENSSIICRELLEADIYSPIDHKIPEVQAKHKVKCPELVASAVRILGKMEFIETNNANT